MSCTPLCATLRVAYRERASGAALLNLVELVARYAKGQVTHRGWLQTVVASLASGDIGKSLYVITRPNPSAKANTRGQRRRLSDAAAATILQHRKY